MCPEAGKHAPLEKAFTMNADEAEDLHQIGKTKTTFPVGSNVDCFFPIHVRFGKFVKGLLGEL